jgi:hypothetical protein
MTELIFRFTPEELEVLQEFVQHFHDVGIPDSMNQEAYDSLYEKVMSN